MKKYANQQKPINFFFVDYHIIYQFRDNLLNYLCQKIKKERYDFTIGFCTDSYYYRCPFGRYRTRSNGRRRFRDTDFCLRTATHSPSDRCNVDDCRGYFGRIMHAGSRRTGLYGEAGRKVIA